MADKHTRRAQRKGNIEVRYENRSKPDNRHYVIERTHGGLRFTLWLTREELETALDCGDDLLAGEPEKPRS